MKKFFILGRALDGKILSDTHRNTMLYITRIFLTTAFYSQTNGFSIIKIQS